MFLFFFFFNNIFIFLRIEQFIYYNIYLCITRRKRPWWTLQYYLFSQHASRAATISYIFIFIFVLLCAIIIRAHRVQVTTTFAQTH